MAELTEIPVCVGTRARFEAYCNEHLRMSGYIAVRVGAAVHFGQSSGGLRVRRFKGMHLVLVDLGGPRSSLEAAEDFVNDANAMADA